MWINLNIKQKDKYVVYRTLTMPSECSSVWLERVVWDHEVAGSSPVIPTNYYYDIQV